MADTPLPSIDSLRKLLRYDPQSGRLFWKNRVAGQYKGGVFGADHSAAKFNTRYAGKEAGSVHPCGYRRVRIWGRAYPTHRVAWAIHHGEWPDGEIDHINHDRADNRLGNLRVVDHAENSRNKSLPCTNTSGAIGVYSVKGTSKWFSIIGVGGKLVNLGTYDTFEGARLAREAAERKYEFHANHGMPA